MLLTILNYQPNSTVPVPEVILHCQSTIPQGIIHVRHQNNLFPPQNFEVNGGISKLLVHLSPGVNNIEFIQYSGQFVNGFPRYDNPSKYAPIALTFPMVYTKLDINPPVNLCLLVALDSPRLYDSPDYKRTNEGNDVAAAVRKLKFGARLMQAFTLEQMRRLGLGNRCFNFTEVTGIDTISSQDQGRVVRPLVAVHVVVMKQTVAQIRDPDVAQQNPNGKRTGALFEYAAEAIVNYRDANPQLGEAWKLSPPTFACMFLDSHWDPQSNLLLGHAALGGGLSDLRLAIFGSQGLWSWPNCYEELYFTFSDCTRTDTNVVVNDCNEAGTAWEALSLSLGAFLHEIGHALGCPHQPSGVMLRDYLWLNRTFMTREFPCSRTRKNGYAPVMPADECGWHRLDMVRFLYHPAFRLPLDYEDPSIDLNAWDNDDEPQVLSLADKVLYISSATGIYLVELYVDNFPRAQLEFLLKSCGGPGPQQSLSLSYAHCQLLLPPQYRNKQLDLKILLQGLKESEIKDFLSTCQSIKSDFGSGHGIIEGFPTKYYGDTKGEEGPVVAFGFQDILYVRVFSGYALDGVEFHFHHGRSVLVGARGGHGTDLRFERDEYIVAFNIRCGAWMDAIQVITNKRVFPMVGNAEGGHGALLTCPRGYRFVALQSIHNQWMRGLRAIYIKE